MLSHLGLLSIYHYEESEGCLRLSFVPLTRGGKELPSNSALDSPAVISKLATPPHAINPDMLQVIDDATSAMNDAYDDASTLHDDDVPLGDFHDVVESEMSLKLKLLKHLLELALLDMNCLRYRKVML